jgi:hypothetical protein
MKDKIIEMFKQQNIELINTANIIDAQRQTIKGKELVFNNGVKIFVPKGIWSNVKKDL